MIIDELIKDEKKINKSLYSCGSYWEYKKKKIILEIKKKGLKDFRGITSGAGTSYTDNMILDVRNEFNSIGKILGKIYSLPIFNNVFNAQLKLTKNHISTINKYQGIIYRNNPNIIK